MRTKNELYSAAMRTVSARRQAARARAEDEKARAMAAVPGLAAAESELLRSGVRAALSGAAGGDRAAATAALNAAKAKRDALLAASGRGPDCLRVKYACPLCEDTGIKDGRTCSCVRALMRRLRREEIEASSSLSVSSFDTMQLSYYPDEKDPASGRNIRTYMSELLEDLNAYADDFDCDSANLLLFGNAGLGKTHAALAIAGKALDKGYDVIYVSSPEFFTDVENLHFSNDSSAEKVLTEAAAEADLLVLDDLGTEMVSSFTISTFYTLLNSRMAAHRPTIFTSNITDDAVMEKRYTEKISSRLLGSCVPFRFIGHDIRAQKAAE